jgi:hypothetical protein
MCILPYRCRPKNATKNKLKAKKQKKKSTSFPCQLEIVICHGLREVQNVHCVHHLLSMETLVDLLHLRRFDENGLSSTFHAQEK